MYLDQLEDFEKIAFSRLAYKMIAYQGIDDHEQKLFYAALGEMGIGVPDLDDEVDILFECQAFSTQRSKRIALVELMLLALADGDLESEESHMIDEIIASFAFDETTLGEAWTWVSSWFQTFVAGKEFVMQGAAHSPVS